MQSILITGSDHDLLRTRAMVLNLAAPRVVCALPDELDDLLQGMGSSQRIDVIVLCHTLASQHPELCIRIHAIAPDALIIMMQEIATPQQADDARCVLLPFGVRPEVLLSTVVQTLKKKIS